MTVQELINRLSKVKDKDKVIALGIDGYEPLEDVFRVYEDGLDNFVIEPKPHSW